jgi:hypothetical protein
LRAETFVSQRRFAWLWIVLVAMLALVGIYWLDHPIGGRNGATRLGYIYGGIATAGIFFLMWYGVRKRYSYRSGSGKLKGWLGSHVWIGVALALLVPLHTGFNIGWNVHSVPYFLMLLTIASGIWGAFAYVRLPSEMEARREGVTVRSCIDQIDKVTREIQVLGKDRSPEFARVIAATAQPLEPSLIQLLLRRPFRALTQDEISAQLATLPREDYQTGLQLIALASRRMHLGNQMVAEAGVVVQMRAWLYFHLPLSFGCVAAVCVHVFWVLFYRYPGRWSGR